MKKTITNSIIDIAGKHLGKTSDGKTMQRYEAPDHKDESLLVPIPRAFGREKSNITPSFVGYDAWHAFEFSYLTENGMPVTGVLKLSYPSTSENMVESKSLKLYLNSFDFDKYAGGIENSSTEVCKVIEKDLANVLGVQTPTDIKVHLHRAPKTNPDNCLDIFKAKGWKSLDTMDIHIDKFEEDPSLLEHKINSKPATVFKYYTVNLRSNCEITNQKDTGCCYIYMKGDYNPMPSELAKYIFSMRNSQHFHENVTEIIYDTLLNRFEPNHLLVCSLYNRRGGLDIHPVRATDRETIDKVLNWYDNPLILHKKTLQS